MAKAIQQIERKQKNAEEERTEDLAAILTQIAENREAIQTSLMILQELHQAGILDMLKGLLRTREKVGSIAIEQINQPGMHNIIKNGMSAVQLLSSLDPNQLKQIFGGLSHGLHKASEGNEKKEQASMWGLMKSMRDPNVRTSLNTMVHFLNGMGEGLNQKQVH
ncbi:hypothetical protein GCM10008967_15790 [Bacillus carboniphilus]|uniref:DUF1641 domain-containing protein n=1 Tax=Bacillus carboniphilus TaxID=86663 RepID=A0ABN0W6E7_9BACI